VCPSTRRHAISLSGQWLRCWHGGLMLITKEPGSRRPAPGRHQAADRAEDRMLAFILFLVIAAIVLGIVGVVVKGLLYLLFIGIVVFLFGVLIGAVATRRRRSRRAR
jgi:Flp pilus assembly protein TadB